MASVSQSVESTAEVALSGVTRRFDETFSLQDVDLSVADGESVVMIGPSASGKTVTLKTIAGLFRPDSGSIMIRGHETIGISDRERSEIARIGVLFQRAALFDSMTVWENITFRLRQHTRLSKQDAIEAAGEKLAAVGLARDTALLYPVELSGGMQKRVGIARVLASQPSRSDYDQCNQWPDPGERPESRRHGHIGHQQS